MTTPDTVYRYAPGVMLRHDKLRDAHILNAPEKLIVLDGPGHAIASRIDGAQTVAQIIVALCELTGLPDTQIGPDVTGFIDDLAGKGLIRAVTP
ncbi:MAG: pyrroloquinoline quinone biosynthesis peptide chaperone PqqD [Alphaproteobacteria bacterium]